MDCGMGELRVRKRMGVGCASELAASVSLPHTRPEAADCPGLTGIKPIEASGIVRQMLQDEPKCVASESFRQLLNLVQQKVPV